MKRSIKKHLSKDQHIYYSDQDEQKENNLGPEKLQTSLMEDFHDQDLLGLKQQQKDLPIQEQESSDKNQEQISWQEGAQNSNIVLSSDFDIEEYPSESSMPQYHANSSLPEPSLPVPQIKSKKILKDNRKSLKNSQDSEKAIKEYKSVNINSQDKNRKIRTTVSQQKIKIMQLLFPYIYNSIPYKGTPLTLKDVAKIANLGYSTILHKYKDFRRKGNVQMGLLLKSKDFKRKYNKSVKMQEYIKQSLKERTFKTAKQLAIYISHKYQINANRSIISRHLNQMQRQKVQTLGQRQLALLRYSATQHYKQAQPSLNSLKSFSRLYFGLKSRIQAFCYLSVIRLYLADGKILRRLSKEVKDFQIINLAIKASQNQLIEYYPQVQVPNQRLAFKDLAKHDSSGYRTLYEQLIGSIEQQKIYRSDLQDKVYLIFPFQDSKRQFQHKQQIIKDLLMQGVNVMVMPPPLLIKQLNFIDGWFQAQILSSIQPNKYQKYQDFRQHLMQKMNAQRNSLLKYANQMIKQLNVQL